MDNIYVVSPTVALVVSVLLQVVKNSSYFPWISRQSGRLNAGLSVLIAFLTSWGIVASFDFDQETGRFAAGFTGNIWDVWHAFSHSIIQWSEQHIFYKGLIVPAEILGEIRAVLLANQQAMVTGLLDTTKKVAPKPAGGE